MGERPYPATLKRKSQGYALNRCGRSNQRWQHSGRHQPPWCGIMSWFRRGLAVPKGYPHGKCRSGRSNYREHRLTTDHLKSRQSNASQGHAPSSTRSDQANPGRGPLWTPTSKVNRLQMVRAAKACYRTHISANDLESTNSPTLKVPQTCPQKGCRRPSTIHVDAEQGVRTGRSWFARISESPKLALQTVTTSCTSFSSEGRLPFHSCQFDLSPGSPVTSRIPDIVVAQVSNIPTETDRFMYGFGAVNLPSSR